MKIGGVDTSHENGSKSWRAATFGILGAFIPTNNQRGSDKNVSPINAFANKVAFTQILIFPKFRLTSTRSVFAKKWKTSGPGKERLHWQWHFRSFFHGTTS